MIYKAIEVEKIKVSPPFNFYNLNLNFACQIRQFH